MTAHALNKTEGLSYLSDAQYLGSTNPAPTSYKIDEQHVRSRSPEWKIPKPLAKAKSYKIIKSKEPDVGTYKGVSIAKDNLMRKVSVAIIGKPKERGFEAVNPEKVTFTHESARLKKFVPGVGSYNPNFEVQNKPYFRKRI